MVSNNEIREYVKEKYGYTPKNAWIAHAKEHYELDVNAAHNRSGEIKWPCPTKRLIEFEEIFLHFKLLKSEN